MLEVSELRTAEERDHLLGSLQRPLEVAAQLGVTLGLETELPQQQYLDIVQFKPHRNLGIYYDVGNATAAGYNPHPTFAPLGDIWLDFI